MKQVDVDYYTDAIRYTQVRVLEIAEQARVKESNPEIPAARSHGDVLVRSQVVGFKKIKFFTNENVGAGKLELPENEMHTTSYWITLERVLLESLPYTISERQSGMFGLLHALESVATLLLMCDRRDLGTAIGERPPSPGDDPDGDGSSPCAWTKPSPQTRRNSSSRICTSSTRTRAASVFPSRCFAPTNCSSPRRAS